MTQDPKRHARAAAVDDLKPRGGPETRHSLCLHVWKLPANLIGGSGGDPPPPHKESTVYCGWSFRCQPAEGWPPLWSPRRPGSCVSGLLSYPLYPGSCLLVGGLDSQPCLPFLAQGETPRLWHKIDQHANHDFVKAESRRIINISIILTSNKLSFKF